MFKTTLGVSAVRAAALVEKRRGGHGADSGQASPNGSGETMLPIHDELLVTALLSRELLLKTQPLEFLSDKILIGNGGARQEECGGGYAERVAARVIRYILLL